MHYVSNDLLLNMQFYKCILEAGDEEDDGARLLANIIQININHCESYFSGHLRKSYKFQQWVRIRC